MTSTHYKSPRLYRTQSSQLFRDSVLGVFAASHLAAAQRLACFKEAVWLANLRWLDTSGLALYLLDRVQELAIKIPAGVLQRLEQNLADNTERNASLLAEAIEISHAFRQHGLRFAHVKGITLSPDAVPNPALRCQLDLDFLIDAEAADTARRLLEGMSYKLDFKVGKTWEFRAGVSEVASIEDLYKRKSQRSMDLHLRPVTGLLERVQVRSFAGSPLSVLAPADQFIAQAKHFFKHLCCAFSRAAWLLEYRRHAIARRHDSAFWDEIMDRIQEEPKAALALGVATLMVTHVFGDPAPDALAQVLSSVPAAVVLWIEAYGKKALLADFPGTKLYLLLNAQLQPKTEITPLVRRSELLPLRRPPMITYGYEGEGMRSRFRRYRTQLHYIVFRLRFHLVEGLRYTLERPRFSRQLASLQP